MSEIVILAVYFQLKHKIYKVYHLMLTSYR